MKPVMYLVANKGLDMSPGKMAAQAAHAAVEAFRISNSKLLDAWYYGGHHTKIVLQADDTSQLETIREYIEARGFKTHLVIDEGRTEIPAFSKTVLGVEVVDKSDPHVAATFESFQTYKPPKPEPVPLDAQKLIVLNYADGCGYLNRRGRQALALKRSMHG